MWAASLALNVHLLKHFHLFEKNLKKIKMLRKLRNEQPLIDHWGRKMNRTIEIYPGDFNKNISRLLKSKVIVDSEPVFCLLDQRMFECHWSTVRALAQYKAAGYKFEQFYFFAIGWLKRSIFGVKKSLNLNKIEDWWGRDDWKGLKYLSREEIFKEMLGRFKNELGYKHVRPFPIFEDRTVEISCIT
jgi:three-Cys-motif partner protein